MNHEIIRTDLSKQKPIIGHPQAMQQTNFKGNLRRDDNIDVINILDKQL